MRVAAVTAGRKYRCQRCHLPVASTICHVNNFGELLCETCEPNAYWDTAKQRPITWREMRLAAADRERQERPGA